MPFTPETPKITPKTFPKTEYVKVPAREKPAGLETLQARQAQANLDATSARANIPGWALGLSVVGFAAGLIYANRQDSGFWGYVGYGIVGEIIFSVPYTFYYYSNLQKK